MEGDPTMVNAGRPCERSTSTSAESSPTTAHESARASIVTFQGNYEESSLHGVCTVFAALSRWLRELGMRGAGSLGSASREPWSAVAAAMALW